jgi:hypothetical protein
MTRHHFVTLYSATSCPVTASPVIAAAAAAAAVVYTPPISRSAAAVQ